MRISIRMEVVEIGVNAEQLDGGASFMVKVVPGSSKTACCEALDGMLKIKVAAAAEKGKANQCLLDFLAKKTGVKKRAISIVSGKSNPVKRIQISGMNMEELLDCELLIDNL